MRRRKKPKSTKTPVQSIAPDNTEADEMEDEELQEQEPVVYGFKGGSLRKLEEKASDGDTLVEATVPFTQDIAVVVRAPLGNTLAWMFDNVLGTGLADTQDFKIHK